jgi:single-stranded DNA-binding protein
VSFFGTITGRLTKDAELKQVSGRNGTTALVKMRVAWDGFEKGEKVAQFHDVEMWGTRAESVHRFLGKGQQIAASGECSSREYEGKTYWTLRASNIDLMGGKSAASESQVTEADFADPPADEEVPF